MNAWSSLPALGSSVGHDTQEAVRQALLLNPVFSYPSFEPVDSSTVVSVSGASADVGESSVKLPTPLPANTSGVVYLVSVTSTATGAGSILLLRHKPGGGNVGGVSSGVLNAPVYGQVVAAPNSGNVTFVALKGSATAYNYLIAVVGFFRSY